MSSPMNIWNSFFSRPVDEVFSATSADEAGELLDDHEDVISTCLAPWMV